MKIGELARATGTKAETVRYYESIGLLPEPDRTKTNYRNYGPDHVTRLGFIRQARGLGFDIADVRSLLDLAKHPERHSGNADGILSDHLLAVKSKIAQLKSLQHELETMIRQCRSGQIGDCQLLESLGSHNPGQSTPD